MANKIMDNFFSGLHFWIFFRQCTFLLDCKNLLQQPDSTVVCSLLSEVNKGPPAHTKSDTSKRKKAIEWSDWVKVWWARKVRIKWVLTMKLTSQCICENWHAFRLINWSQRPKFTLSGTNFYFFLLGSQGEKYKGSSDWFCSYWRFPARPFYSQMQWAKNEKGLYSSQNLSTFSISSLKTALNCL